MSRSCCQPEPCNNFLWSYLLEIGAYHVQQLSTVIEPTQIKNKNSAFVFPTRNSSLFCYYTSFVFIHLCIHFSKFIQIHILLTYFTMQWNKSKIRETRKILALLCDVKGRYIYDVHTKGGWEGLENYHVFVDSIVFNK